jgi:hypothetical protein
MALDQAGIAAQAMVASRFISGQLGARLAMGAGQNAAANPVTAEFQSGYSTLKGLLPLHAATTDVVRKMSQSDPNDIKKHAAKLQNAVNTLGAVVSEVNKSMSDVKSGPSVQRDLLNLKNHLDPLLSGYKAEAAKLQTTLAKEPAPKQ